MTNNKIFVIIVLISALSFNTSAQDGLTDYSDRAILLFKSVYEGDISNIEKIASEKIVVSYPIFLKKFNQNALHGLEAYKQFASNFNSNWKDGEVTIHESISDGNKVVLIWSFKGTRVNLTDQDSKTEQEFSWGGISVFRFDDFGKIVEEFGEESNPGPFNRLK